MTLDDLRESLRAETNPVIFEFWAPWCAPCRMMAPALDQLGQEYAGRVTLRKINADENAELLRALNVLAIPTMLVFQGGEEIQRRVGAQSPPALRGLFEQLAQGETSAAGLRKAGMDPVTRMLRLASGLLLGMLGIWFSSWPMLILGGLVAFWGWYDRCPVWQAVYPRIKALFART